MTATCDHDYRIRAGREANRHDPAISVGMSILYDPISCLANAIETVLGWTCAHLLTWYLGSYIRLCVGQGELGNPFTVPLVILGVLLALLFESPYFVLSFIAFLVFWALPLYFDSSRARATLLLLGLSTATFSGYALTNVEFG